MPWKGLRSNTASSRKPRRHSLAEKGESPTRQRSHETEQAGTTTQLSDAPDTDLTEAPLSPTSSATASTQTALDTSSDRLTSFQQANSRDPARASRNHRFSLLKFRHASDPQLSKTYAAGPATSRLAPPPMRLATPTIITTAPGASASTRNTKPTDGLDSPGTSPTLSGEESTDHHQGIGSALDGGSQSNPILGSSDPTGALATKSHVSFEDQSRLSSTLAARGAPPAYGEASIGSLHLPPSRLSESSRSDASSGEHGIYAETTTTHVVSTTTTFFRLPRRKKAKNHLFPLPVKIPPPPSNARGQGPGPALTSDSSSPQSGRPVTAIYEPGVLPSVDSEHPSPLPSPTHSAVALTNAPLGSPGRSLFRKDSFASRRSVRSAQGTPIPPPFLGFRGRSSTTKSMDQGSNADRQSSPQLPPSGRTSTSTSGRKSFGDIFSLSQKRWQSSDTPNATNGKGQSGTPGTPGSVGSKSNSFQIPREAPIYPERVEDDSPATYLTRLEEAVHRGVIAAILCKGLDEFSKICLRKYMRGFSYFGDSIDMAVRKMLMEVELPKETQQIDRLLQGFADRYCECNPGIFTSTDEAYFVAFSILLLHSDTHNKSNKRKMQKQDYVKNTTGQVEVSGDILECFYDNVSYTPFIHFEDEVAINSHRMGAPKAKKGLFNASGADNLRGPIDPYALILEQKLDMLRPSLKEVMDTDDRYNCIGSTSVMDAESLYQAFHKAGSLQIVSARSRPDAFLSQSTIINPAEGQVGLVDIKAAKVGLIWRKDPKKKKARSPWQEWGALLTGSQLYFFRDVAWVKTLIVQHETHHKSGSDGKPIVFKPPLDSFQPDAFLSMDDVVVLQDAGYKKHKHAFLFVKHGGLEEVFLANSETDMNDWMAKLNYAATFRTAGIRMRGLLGAKYEGERRPEIRRGESVTSAKSPPIDRVEGGTSGRQINQQLAGEILVYRRQMMTVKITEADDRLRATQKELDQLLRNARHLQVCLPIQTKTREAVVLAAARMAARLKWTRVNMWKTRCHRDVMKMDLEHELGPKDAASFLHASSSIRLSPSMRPTPLSIDGTSMNQAGSLAGDGAASLKSTDSVMSSLRSTPTTKQNWNDADILSNTMSDGSLREALQLSVGPLQQPFGEGEGLVSAKARDSPGSIKRPLKQRLNHSPSATSSHVARNDGDGIDQFSSLAARSASLQSEEQLLRDAGLMDVEQTVSTSGRPDTSGSEQDVVPVTSADGQTGERTGSRRSLHRTLREGPILPQGQHSLRHRKHKEGTSTTSPANTLKRPPPPKNQQSLARGTGSFILHGKKASVVTFGSEWQSMSSDERVKFTKQSQADGKGGGSEEGLALSSSPRMEADDGADDGVESVNRAVNEQSARCVDSDSISGDRLGIAGESSEEKDEHDHDQSEHDQSGHDERERASVHATIDDDSLAADSDRTDLEPPNSPTLSANNTGRISSPPQIANG